VPDAIQVVADCGSMKGVNMIVEQYKKGNEIFRIITDDDPMDPRECDNLGVITTWHRRYTLGDIRPQEDPAEFIAGLPEGSVVLPVYMYDHSGLALSTSPFSCPWDSGQLGIIYATPERVEELGVAPEDVEKALRSEVETYGQYISGDVYGYRKLLRSTCGTCGQTEEEELDSCWGFYGTDWEENGLLYSAGVRLAEWDELDA
jgi:hypothetical protein